MGVKLKELFSGRETNLGDLSGKTIAVDAFNWIYQFLTTIRLADGSYLVDREGNITTHLNGLFYRCMNLLSNKIRPSFVFDGPPPKFKKTTNLERSRAREEAKRLAEAAKTGEERAMYLKRAVKVDDYIINSSKELLTLIGIPVIQAPAEGEAQAARMNSAGLVYGVASQDYDTLLFGANRLIRNLNVTNKKKVANKGILATVLPEIIESKTYKESLGISREQLILIALFVGTDYNDGVKGIGPKKALAIVKKESVEKLLASYDFGSDYEIKEIFDYFLNPKVEETVKTQESSIQTEKLIDFLCSKHSFDEERVRSYLSKIKTDEKSLFDYE
jgi:flap endonuclease-1